jgi:hypothetical protein
MDTTQTVPLDEAAQRTIGRQIAAACRSDAFYELLADWSCGAFDGGCLMVADALQQALGAGDIVGLMGHSRGPRTQRGAAITWQHAVLHVGFDLYLDGDGFSSEATLRRRWRDQEGVIVTEIAPMAPRHEWPRAYPYTPHHPAIVAQLAELFRKALP